MAPIKQIRIKTRTEPWMNNKILELIQERDKALNLAIKNKTNNVLRQRFNFLRNKVQREVKKGKTDYFKNKIDENKNNPKQLWKQFKSLGYSNKSKVNSKIVLETDDEICFEPQKIAQYMNNNFFNIAFFLVNKLPSPLNIFTINSSLLKKNYSTKNVMPNSFVLNPVSEQF